ncbi:head-tail connector protein [Sphingomonas sp.]|jgi:uncharacterized phiE125 gp8 family phage protein|uniref:head-tail connector protein n=1 Tax=Sphingomonas sp. TaxID=28214 RepID=UPI002EDB851E
MTLDDAKAYLRLEGTSEDALIERLVATATGLCEAYLGQALVAREMQDMLPASGAWQRLGTGPVHAITAVEGVPAEGAAFALSPDAYAIDVDAAGDGWVRVMRPGAAGRVRVTYEAGMAADTGAVPAPIGQGVTRLVEYLYADRDGRDGPPAAVAALWRPYRRVRLAPERRA